MLAIAMASSAAWADCTPDPTVASGTTICTGVDSDGLAVSTTGTQVQVSSGAEVRGGAQGASIVSAFPASDYAYNYLGVQVDGTLSDGVRVTSGSPVGQYGSPSTDLNVTVSASGSIAGDTAIRLDATPGNSNGFATASVTNAGSIRSTSGAALVSTNGALAGFSQVTNQAGGFIGGIAAPAGYLTNGGTIDGGAGSAYGFTTSGYRVTPYNVTNTGTIQSSGSAATLQLPGTGNLTIANSGQITNSGSGDAIDGIGLAITNAVGATIDTAGGVAIGAVNLVNLTNRGTINGSITVAPQLSPYGYGYVYGGSFVDTSGGGKINGNVALGDGDDTFVTDYTAGGGIAGVSGTVDAGGGNNRLREVVSTDTSVASLVLPAGFSSLALQVAAGATATLADGVVLPGILQIMGGGTVVNAATVDASGTIIQSSDNAPSFTNNGSITSHLSDGTQYALNFSNADSVINAGSINAIGGGAIYLPFSNSFTNSGTIDATGTGAYLLLFGGSFTNSGRISSSGGIGVYLSQPPVISTSSSNTGLIEGAVAGVEIGQGILNNYGTIQSAQTAILFDSASGVYNHAGGTITGGNAAVTGTYGSAFDSTVINAGTINGSVNFGRSFYSGTGNVYDALAGGVLNGDLVLGSGGDLFITDLVNTGTGAYAGVTGTVSGTGPEAIRYRVTQDSSTTLPDRGVFSSVGYQLSSGAKLTLTVSRPDPTGVLFAGAGIADLYGDLSSSSAPLVTSGVPYQLPDDTSTYDSTALNIVSHGTLTLSADAQTPFGASAVQLSGGGNFTNAGTILLSNGAYSGLVAVRGGNSVVNSGTISLDGGTGIFSATSINNSGLIEQAAGGAFSQGITDASSVVNSGTIATGGDAVSLGSYPFSSGASTLDNSGTIASSGGIGVTSPYYASTVINRAGGMISGATDAVALAGGSSLTNAGTINGNVSLGTGPYGGGSSTYVADGGTLNGDLGFGAGDDHLVVVAGATGVTGTIDGGGGINTYVQRFTSSSTAQLGATLPTNFQQEGIEAFGAGTVVTFVNPSGGVPSPVAFYGYGAIINQADILGSANGQANLVTLAGPLGGTTGALDFTNAAAIGDGVSGTARSFTNSGNIASATLPHIAVDLTVPEDQAFSFNNGGTIQSSGSEIYYQSFSHPVPAVYVHSSNPFNGPSSQTATVINSGTITGGLAAELNVTSIDFTNSGSISGGQQLLPTVFLGGLANVDYSPTVAPAVRMTNSGTITAGGAGSSALVAIAEAFSLYVPNGGGDLRPSLSLVNNGTIAANQDAIIDPFSQAYEASAAVGLEGNHADIALTNAAGGSLSAIGKGSVAVAVEAEGGTLQLTNAGTITGGPGVTTPSDVQISGTFYFEPGYLAGAVNVSGATSLIRNSGTITGSTRLADGSDRIENSGTIDGDVFLGDGDDSFADLATATLTGMIDGGGGTNALVLDTTGSTGAAFDPARFVEFQSLALTGTGSIGLAGALSYPTVQLMGGGLTVAAGTTLSTAGPVTVTGSDAAETLVNLGTIGGGVDLGGGNDRFENHGTVEGAVMLGDGDDTYAIYGGANVGGGVDGGAGTNTIELHSSGTDAAPVIFTAAGKTGFERLDQAEGVTAVSGSASYAQIAVTGGRLIGLVGSTLVASGGISVASGATFGSAGTVVGNVAVAGTLAPGASPGTMTVTGNVSLAAGSTSLFEVTPTVSDQLLISGTLGIASGATLTLVGDRPLVPGSALDLVVADGGITGSFATINKPGSILGFVAQRGNRIQLLGQFRVDGGFAPQVAATVNYVNGVLVSGQASTALIAAIPSLLTTGGGTSAASFARLNPEAYASATQISVENALTLAEASRTGAAGSGRQEAGLYTFAQGLGAWRTLDGDGARGTSRANVSSYGVLGGIGIGAETASIAGFGGYLNGHQSIGPLGARNHSDGVVAGLMGHVAAAGFDLSALLAYDGGKAGTRRALPGGGTATSRYRLHGWVADGQLGYTMPLSAGWALKPQAGVTAVRTRRGSADETGGSPFALVIDGRKTHATFVDGALTLKGGMEEGATFHPWVSGGVRRQLAGGATFATAGFIGTTSDFTVAGVARRRTQPTGSAGVDFDISRGINLFATYRGEFGKDGTGSNVNGGVRVRF